MHTIAADPLLFVFAESPRSTALYEALWNTGFLVLWPKDAAQRADAATAGVYAALIAPHPSAFADLDDLVQTVGHIRPETAVILVRTGAEESSAPPPWCTACLPADATAADIAAAVTARTGRSPSRVTLPTRAPGTWAPDAGAASFVSIFPNAVHDAPQEADDADPLAAFQARLAAQYAAELRGECATLRALFDQLMHGTPDEAEDIVADIRRRTHTISGTAGTLGLRGLGHAASRLNAVAKQWSPQRAASLVDQARFLLDGMNELLAVDAPAPRTSLVAPSLTPPQSTTGTVVVLSASEKTRTAMDALFANGVVQGTCVPSVDALLEFCAHNQPLGVLVDMDAPDFDATQAVHALRDAANDGPAVPIAFMTDTDDVAHRIAAVDAGAIRYLLKPVTSQDVTAFAQECASARNAGAARILICDDDAFFRAHLRALLESAGLAVDETDTPEHILDALDESDPDVLLLDVQMPKISGFDTCRMLRQTPRWRDLPVLFLTAASEVSDRIACFESGGDDYIQKPAIKEELLARIAVRLERQRFFKERADIDPLTGLLNRRAFLEAVTERMRTAQRTGVPLSLCVIDLDKFKSVNDVHGHLAGDRVLATAGRLLQTRFRTVDVRGRWGGEEFAVVFFGEPASTAAPLLRSAKAHLKRHAFTGDKGGTFHVSFSAGVATFPDDAQSFDVLFKIADRRLYLAKERGRDTVVTSDDP